MIIATLFLPFSSLDLRAQVAAGTIVGTARDSSGAIVPKANITCKSVETGVVRNVVANDLGAFTIPALPVGTYDLEASLQGFKTEARKGITVTVGTSFRAEFFNLFNHANFQEGRALILDGNSKVVSSALQIQAPTLTTAREIQLGVKLLW
jgi:hypothetical protein